MFAPLPKASETTLEWLQNSGVDLKRIKHSVGRNWVEVETFQQVLIVIY